MLCSIGLCRGHLISLVECEFGVSETHHALNWKIAGLSFQSAKLVSIYCKAHTKLYSVIPGEKICPFEEYATEHLSAVTSVYHLQVVCSFACQESKLQHIARILRSKKDIRLGLLELLKKETEQLELLINRAWLKSQQKKRMENCGNWRTNGIVHLDHMY